ncbi:hypothetical protein Maq22A_2p42670 (plasmid) [Methylobacterium aquaticum]|uniref:Uncharacterized protein n=1 Tax=Methylobacterium aquaticum TaxID=270351 RepID=A0A1Y0ZG28_9HYPH|nr:hypothetical protein Maq22A_2p42670 [Methylobacterium aquaticum]
MPTCVTLTASAGIDALMPSAPGYLWQVRLNSGDGRRSLSADVTKQSLVVVRPRLNLKAEQSVAGLGLERSRGFAALRSGRARSPRRRPSSSASTGARCRC